MKHRKLKIGQHNYIWWILSNYNINDLFKYILLYYTQLITGWNS
jgi:hypothetical protein